MKRTGVEYGLVPAVWGCVFLCLWQNGWETGRAMTAAGFLAVLAAVSLQDMIEGRIGDGWHLAILLLAAVSLVTMPETANRLSGAFCVSLPMLLLTLLVPGAFGGGDIKLTAVCGLFMGRAAMLASVFPALLSGSLFACGLLITGRADGKTRFAFGPGLCLGMTVGFFWGEWLTELFG